MYVLSIKLRDKLYFSFSIPTLGVPHFYYMLGANLGLLLYGEVSMMNSPNHRGRHLGKMNGHNSTYVKAWRCTFGRITRVVMGKSWGKLL